MSFQIAQQTGTSYNLDVGNNSLNCIRQYFRILDFLPIPDYNYGYYYAGSKHFTQRTLSHDYYQIFITHNGSGKFIIDQKEYLTTKNTVVILNMNYPHIYQTEGDSWEYEWVNFTGTSCGYYYQKINPNGFTVYDLSESPDLKMHMSTIRELMPYMDEQKYMQTGTAILGLLDAFSDLAAHRTCIGNKNCQNGIQTVVQYINEHYMDDLSLDMLSEMAFLSKYYFTHAFAQYTGMTPYRYVTSVRLAHARQYLILTRQSIEEISWRVGFGNSKNLIRAFKLAMGQTPQQYRVKTRESHLIQQ